MACEKLGITSGYPYTAEELQEILDELEQIYVR